MPPIGTKNLGLIKAIHVGVNPPLNTKILWYNDANTPYTTGPAKVHYYYDVILADWYPLLAWMGAGNFTYIAFAETCDAEGFSMTFVPGTHCYWAIINSVTPIAVLDLVPALFEGKWTKFCSCDLEGASGNFTYIAYSDDCGESNFSTTDLMYEVPCTGCEMVDSFVVESGSSAYAVANIVDGIEVTITGAVAGNQVVINLMKGGLPLDNLINYCIDISTMPAFTGELNIHLGNLGTQLTLNAAQTEWKNLVQNNGSQLIIKVPDGFVGSITEVITIKIGTAECCAIQPDGKCYCPRGYWALITSPTAIAPIDLVPALFEGKWIATCGGDCECSETDCAGEYWILSQQIENLNQNLLNYIESNDTRVQSVEDILSALQLQITQCCDDLNARIDGLELTLNNAIAQFTADIEALQTLTETQGEQISGVEGTLTEEGLAPLVQPTIDTTMNDFITGQYATEQAAQDAATSAVAATAASDLATAVGTINDTTSAQRTTLDDHELRITALEVP